MSYERSMGAEPAAPAPADPPVATMSPLIDLRARDFSAQLNQPALDWLPFWLGCGAGLFVGWLVFRNGSSAQQLDRIRDAAMERIFGATAPGATR